jgi:hypothetical protein
MIDAGRRIVVYRMTSNTTELTDLSEKDWEYLGSHNQRKGELVLTTLAERGRRSMVHFVANRCHTSVTGGNFRLLAQLGRILEINGLATVTREVVEASREVLVIVAA